MSEAVWEQSKPIWQRNRNYEEVKAMGSRNAFRNEEKECGSWWPISSNHAKSTCSEGASWHQRDGPHRSDKAPGTARGWTLYFLLFLSLGYLASSGYSLNPPSLLDMEPQGSLCSFQRESSTDQGRWSAFSSLCYLTPSAVHRFGNTASSLSIVLSSKVATVTLDQQVS